MASDLKLTPQWKLPLGGGGGSSGLSRDGDNGRDSRSLRPSYSPISQAPSSRSVGLRPSSSLSSSPSSHSSSRLSSSDQSVKPPSLPSYRAPAPSEAAAIEFKHAQLKGENRFDRNFPSLEKESSSSASASTANAPTVWKRQSGGDERAKQGSRSGAREHIVSTTKQLHIARNLVPQSSKRTTKDKKTGSGSVGLKAKSTVNYSAPRRSDRKGTKLSNSTNSYGMTTTLSSGSKASSQPSLSQVKSKGGGGGGRKKSSFFRDIKKAEKQTPETEGGTLRASTDELATDNIISPTTTSVPLSATITDSRGVDSEKKSELVRANTIAADKKKAVSVLTTNSVTKGGKQLVELRSSVHNNRGKPGKALGSLAPVSLSLSKDRDDSEEDSAIDLRSRTTSTEESLRGAYSSAPSANGITKTNKDMGPIDGTLAAGEEIATDAPADTETSPAGGRDTIADEDADEATNPLAFSDEAEERLLRQLGWQNEDDEEFDGWLTEEEIRATRIALEQKKERPDSE